MNAMGKIKNTLGSIFGLLSHATEVSERLPIDILLQVEKVSKVLDAGLRRRGRIGQGMEFFDSREYQIGDDPRKRNAKLSQRVGKVMIVENEAETSQRIYFWRKRTDPPEMNTEDFASPRALCKVSEALDIMLLGFAKHLAENQEYVGLLNGQGVYSGAGAYQRIAQQLSVVGATGNMAKLNRRLPRDSVVVLLSDFLPDDKYMEEGLDGFYAEIAEGLDGLVNFGLQVKLIQGLDPAELDFDIYKGHVKFQGKQGGELIVQDAMAARAQYLQRMNAHNAMLEKLCADRGCKFYRQRTDQPLHKALLEIYGIVDEAPAQPLALKV